MLIPYLFNSFLFRIKEFLRHWYIKSFFVYSHFVISQLEKIDRVLAFKITLRYLFHPLYQDRTVLGYIFGFIFRSARLLISATIYLFIILIAILVYFIWLAFPVYIIFKIIYG